MKFPNLKKYAEEIAGEISKNNQESPTKNCRKSSEGLVEGILKYVRVGSESSATSSI